MSESDDLLEPAVAALRDSPIPPGPTPELLAKALNAVNQRLASTLLAEQNRKLQRRKRIMQITKYGSLSAGLAAAVALAVIAWFPTPSAASEVKKALEKMEAAKSCRFQMETEVAPGVKTTAKMYLSEGNARQVDDGSGMTATVNMKDKKSLVLMSKTKQYMVMSTDDEKTQKMIKSAGNMMSSLSLPTGDKIQALPDEYLDGRRTKTYEIKNVDIELNDQKMNMDMNYWIDPKTGYPVQAVTTIRINGMTVKSKITYLGFNEDLDPKLFDMTIPEGYTEMVMPKVEKPGQ
jgi:outer membrane lipoprotein-sorting protein